MAIKTNKQKAQPLNRHEALGLTLDDATGMYRAMLLTRMLGERMMQMNRMGRAAFVGVADGHEAAEVGSAWVIKRGSPSRNIPCNSTAVTGYFCMSHSMLRTG